MGMMQEGLGAVYISWAEMATAVVEMVLGLFESREIQLYTFYGW